MKKYAHPEAVELDVTTVDEVLVKSEESAESKDITVGIGDLL